jgi:hypothetical protein
MAFLFQDQNQGTRNETATRQTRGTFRNRSLSSGL